MAANYYSITLQQIGGPGLLAEFNIFHQIPQSNPADALEVFTRTILGNIGIMGRIGRFCIETNSKITLYGPEDAMEVGNIERAFNEYSRVQDPGRLCSVRSGWLTVAVRKSPLTESRVQAIF